MKYLIIDISGKVPEYDEGLCSGIAQYNKEKNVFFAAPFEEVWDSGIPVVKLFRITPKRMPQGMLRRVVKLLEVILNYIYIIYIIARNRPEVIQMEWLPLIEKMGCELYFLKLFKKLSPNSRIILKIHNVFPHECTSSNARTKYVARFKKAASCSSAFIVHNKSSKKEVSDIFGIEEGKIHIIHHGVFEPKDCSVEARNIGERGKWNFLMYGIQSQYKGADILVKAYRQLRDDVRERVKITIVGMMSDDYLEYLTNLNIGGNLTIKPGFIEYPDLYKMINNSDVIVLPYRKISQSGVLLLAMHFKRCLITSDLESFKETLDGFDDEWFFKSEDAESLAFLITRYVNEEIDTHKQISIIQKLNEKYSWKEAGKLNIQLLKKI